MVHSKGSSLQFGVCKNNDEFCTVVITIPAQFVNAIYQEIIKSQQSKTHAYGFAQGSVPLTYIEHNFKPSLIEHIKEFLFKYFVIKFLYQEIKEHKILLAGEPRILEIVVQPDQPAEFYFELTLAQPITFQKWKDFAFKASKRKNYKDIDRQVESFIKDEQTFFKDHPSNGILVNDWVCFDIYPLSEELKPLFEHHRENLWLKIGDEEADIPFQQEFLSKTPGIVFHSTNPCFQDYFSEVLESFYNFCIEIKDVLHHGYFYFDHFKQHFKLKANKDIPLKLTEIFSFRNDLSQRRHMVEDALKLLITKHPFDVSNHLVLRQQKIVLESVQSNPDYLVYKHQSDFQSNIRLLALKQLKETILIDQLAYAENINVSSHEIKGYLNLLKRPRTKDFIYFNPPTSKIKGQETPLPAEILKQCCLREKTLNHVLYYLTRK